jgi:hypothetical protein
MNKLPPYRKFLIDPTPKPGSRWWHWYPDLFSDRAIKYDEEVRFLNRLAANEPIPETLKAMPTPKPLSQATLAEIEVFNSRMYISFVNPNASVPEETRLDRLRYSNAGMIFRYDILYPVTGRLLDIIMNCALLIVKISFYLFFLLYFALHTPYRIVSSLIRKKHHAVGSE